MCHLPRRLKRGASLDLQDGASKPCANWRVSRQPSPTLTLKPVPHQRRANRSQTEIRPSERTPTAWTGTYHNEARDCPPGIACAPSRRPPRQAGQRRQAGGKEVNGNLKPDKNRPKRNKYRRKAAPGQELPSVRSWFAGDERPGAGAVRASAMAKAIGATRRRQPPRNLRQQ